MFIKFLKNHIKLLSKTFMFLFIISFPYKSMAAGEKIDYPKLNWSFSSIIGTFDRASQQRGL